MCGRYSLSKPKKIKAEDLRVPQAQLDRLKPRFNIAPSQQVAAILEDGSSRHVEPLRWGLVPSWAKDEGIGHKMINARAETLAEKPSFRKLLNKHRCLILADGFYEWRDTGSGKQPYFIHMKDEEPFTFAGLWSHWMDPKGGEVRTCTIITCSPNKLMAPIHNRMPVILEGDAREEWLDPKSEAKAHLVDLLKPFHDDRMEAYPVSKLVNSPMNDTDCIKSMHTGLGPEGPKIQPRPL